MRRFLIITTWVLFILAVAVGIWSYTLWREAESLTQERQQLEAQLGGKLEDLKTERLALRARLKRAQGRLASLELEESSSPAEVSLARQQLAEIEKRLAAVESIYYRAKGRAEQGE